MKFTIYTCDYLLDRSASIVRDMLETEGFSIDHKRDRVETMIRSKGKVNPTTGYVVVAPDDTVLFDIYDVVHYIEERGLKRC